MHANFEHTMVRGGNMANQQKPFYAEDQGAALDTGGEAFDFGSVFGQVKDWIVKNDDKIIEVVVPWLRGRLETRAWVDGRVEV